MKECRMTAFSWLWRNFLKLNKKVFISVRLRCINTHNWLATRGNRQGCVILRLIIRTQLGPIFHILNNNSPFFSTTCMKFEAHFYPYINISFFSKYKKISQCGQNRNNIKGELSSERASNAQMSYATYCFTEKRGLGLEKIKG